MTEYTFRAPNTARAMDRVQRELGDDAYILSIRNAGGQVEIRATTEPVAALASAKNSPARIEFARHRAERAIMPVTPSPLMTGSLNPSETVSEPKLPTKTAVPAINAPETSKVIHFAHAFRAAAGTYHDTAHTDTALPAALKPAHSPASDTPIAEPSAKDSLRSLFATPEPKDAETMLHSAGNRPSQPNENMPPLTPAMQFDPPSSDDLSQPVLRLHAANLLISHGFSAAFVATMPDPMRGMNDEAILALAVARLAHDLAPDGTQPSPLAAPLVFVSGPPGGGKSLLAAKIAQTRHSRSAERCQFMEVRSRPEAGDHRLRAHAKVMGLDFCDYNEPGAFTPRAGAPCIVEIACADAPAIVETLEDAIPTRLVEAASRVLILPATWGTRAICRLLEGQENDCFTVAITQMDLANFSVAEFCAIWSHGVRITVIGREKEVTNGLIEASEELITTFVERAIASVTEFE